MKEEEAIKKLQECIMNDSTEKAHIYADEVLCDFLVSLGYKEIVENWERVNKWYA